MDLLIDTLGSERAVARTLFGISGRVVDVEPAMGDVLDLIRRATRAQFDSEGASGSGGWPRLAESTIRRKGNARVLRDTDALYRALTGETGESVAITKADGLDFGTTLFYAHLHQTGTGRMPRRRPVQLPDRTRQEAARIVQRFVIEGDRGLL